jgi:hypothetical protein
MTTPADLRAAALNAADEAHAAWMTGAGTSVDLKEMVRDAVLAAAAQHLRGTATNMRHRLAYDDNLDRARREACGDIADALSPRVADQLTGDTTNG